MLTKARLAYIGATFLILLSGLSTRIYAEVLPDFVSAHFGDALWAAMIYCGFRVIGVKKRLEWALLSSSMFCLVIEVSQLYQAGWIDAIRDTVWGGLILGQGFLAIDLVRYAVGILFVYFADRACIKHVQKRSKQS